MQTRVDEALRADAETYGFRFSCEHCAHFDPSESACGEGFPSDEHREVDLRAVRVIVFCKSFELA